MVMGNESLVSVVIPVYNRERYLAEAIESVLGQSCGSTEIIVVDDGSTDGSGRVAKGFGSRVRYTRQDNGGIGAARNTGVEMAAGSFIAFLDSDDIWTEDKLELQMKAFEEMPHLDIIFGHVKQFCSPELTVEARGKVRCPEKPMPGYVPSAVIVRRDAFFRVGLFDAGRKTAEFMDWYLRAVELGFKARVLPQVMVKRRIHDTNHGITERMSQKEYVRILKASLDRRRSATGGD